MKLNPNPRTNVDAETARVFREVANQVNALSEGTAAAHYQSATSAPTTGTAVNGDFVYNSNQTELGTAGNKYVVRGWVCVAAGTPGTWVQARFLTGN